MTTTNPYRPASRPPAAPRRARRAAIAAALFVLVALAAAYARYRFGGPFPGVTAAQLARVRGELPPGYADVLEAPDALEVIAITGNIDSEIASLPPDDAPLAAGEWNYRGMRARPPAVVRDPGARRRVIAGLYRSMVHDDAMANCFAPHHAVRARRGGRTIELVVCFLCSQAVVLTDRGQQVRVAISDAARGPLDDALRAAGVTPPPAGH